MARRKAYEIAADLKEKTIRKAGQALEIGEDQMRALESVVQANPGKSLLIAFTSGLDRQHAVLVASVVKMSFASLAAQIVLNGIVRPRSKPVKKDSRPSWRCSRWPVSFVLPAPCMLIFRVLSVARRSITRRLSPRSSAGLALYISPPSCYWSITAKLARLRASRAAVEIEPPSFEQQIESDNEVWSN